jgi:hypothetical protein
MTERKASDVILDLENKIEILIKKIDSQDLLLKAQHNKMNELFKILLKEKPKQNIKIINPEISAPKIPKIKEEIKQEPILKIEDPKEEFKEYTDQKFKITQRVLDSNGKPVYMAAVQMINLADNSIIARPLTKANGKFSIELPAGKYRFKYSKQIDLKSERKEKILDIVILEDKTLEDLVLT